MSLFRPSTALTRRHEAPTRRHALALIGALPLTVAAARGENQYALRGADGAPIENFRIPVEFDPGSLPGVIWKGAESADVSLYEFFDYNCGYCFAAARELDRLAAKDHGLRIGLVNSPILSVGSVQAAKTQQGVLRLHGPAVAYDFHMRLFAKRGQKTGPMALAVVRDMGLDAKKVEEAANHESVARTISRQARLATSAGMEVTPSFAIAGTGLLGWPGAASLGAIVASARKCDHPACDKG
jgi:protein-disulfide isomerase